MTVWEMKINDVVKCENPFFTSVDLINELNKKWTVQMGSTCFGKYDQDVYTTQVLCLIYYWVYWSQ